MEINLIKENIKTEQIIENTTTQILVEGDIIVPDTNPDILEILENDANIVIEKINITENRVNYIGKLDVQILYISKNGGGVHSMSNSIAIDEFINIDGVDDKAWADTEAVIQNIEYNILNDRKISTRSVVDINIICQKECEQSFLVDTQELTEKQVKKSAINVNRVLNKINDRFILKDQLFVHKSSENIASILKKEAMIINRDFRCANGKIYVSAEVLVCVLYKSDSIDSIIENIEKEISLSGYIDASDVTDDMFADVKLNISEFICNIKPDDDGEDRVIDVEISVTANAKVSKETEVCLIDDGYVIGKELILDKKEMKYPKLVCRNKNQSTIKEIIRVSGEDVMQVFKVSANSLIEDVVISDDKLIIEGIINASVLYIAQNDESPLCSHKSVVPFRQIVEVRGARSFMDKKIFANIDHIGFSMISDKEIELRVLMSFNAEFVEMISKTIVTDMTIIDKPREEIEKIPSMVIYVVQKGDRLWDIAKRYNTDIDDIIEVNEIENPDIIFEGQKLLILKKVMI